jgi:hypothetical protein
MQTAATVNTHDLRGGSPRRAHLYILGAAAILALALALGTIITEAKPASAAVDFQVNPRSVCSWQYPSPGAFVYRYCAVKFPGSRAVVIRNGWYALDDWYCRYG